MWICEKGSHCVDSCDDCEHYIEVEEVVHGYWEEYWDNEYLSYSYRCSECKNDALTKEETMHDQVLSAYCPRCGVKMDGGKECV